MPSLNALQEFRFSFSNIGNEKADCQERDIPYEELELPETESAAVQQETAEIPEAPGLAPDDFSTPDFNFNANNVSGLDNSAGDLDFGAFMDTEPEHVEEPQGTTADSFDLGNGLPDLGGDSLDLGSELPDLGDDSLVPEKNTLDLSSGTIDLGGELPDLGSVTDQTPGESSELPDLGDDAFDFGTGDISELPDLGGDTIDLGGETLDLGGEMPLETESTLPDLDDLGLGAETPDETHDLEELSPVSEDESLNLGGESFDLGGDAFDLGGDSFDLGSETPSFGGGDDFGISDMDFDSKPVSDSSDESLDELMPIDSDIDSFDIGSEISADTPSDDSFDTFGSGTGSSAGSGAESHDFTLPGIDDLFGDSPAVPVGPGAKPTARKEPSPSDDVEEILLNDEQLARFKKTLSGYPLNLRLACKEIIAEQVIAPNLMSQIVKLLVNGASAKESATLAGKILNKTITVPKGFQKSTGEAMEAEQASFAYIFVHKFLPVFRLVAMIGIVVFCVCYLIYKFIYTPLHAESIYKIGYERIFAGEYQRANERFNDAFSRHKNKNWFYKYAEAFRDERQYIYAEQKYDELLYHYPRDKKGVLDYANLQTNYLRNYDKADRLLRRELLDFAPDDFDGLLALGDNSLAWGEVDSEKFEDARFAYARLLSKYGWKDPIVERMMKYFIRTDNLKEVLPLYDFFTYGKKRKISPETLAELGGYLLDKQLEEQRGIPNEYIQSIQGVRDLLIKAVEADPSIPEAHYHLSRYYHNLGNFREERITLETAIDKFNKAGQETIRRLNYRIDAYRRYGDILIDSREFFAASDALVKGINLYEDALSRRLINRSAEFGKLYAGLGDLEYFTKSGDWGQALNYYHRAEQNGWSPPEVQYRMGNSYYQQGNWKNALEYFFTASADLPLNRRLLFALGNASFNRNDYFASQGYYNRLLDILETDRARLPALMPRDRPEFQDLAERLMMARNNAGVAYEALAERTGNQGYRSRALALYAESSRSWDALTRDVDTMIRSVSVPLPHLNSRNALYPQVNYEPQIFSRLDMDVLEPSIWEQRMSPGRY